MFQAYGVPNQADFDYLLLVNGKWTAFI